MLILCKLLIFKDALTAENAENAVSTHVIHTRRLTHFLAARKNCPMNNSTG